MAENTLIPNTFQHPNAYIDWLSYYLTPEEEKVLNKAIREIIGWRDKIESRKGRIALSVFADGKFKNGERVCMGCGLSKDTIRKALASLDHFHILRKCGEPTQDGQEYELNLDYDSLDWGGIRARRCQWDEQNQGKTAAAREALQESRQEGVLSDSTLRGLSDSTKETQASLETQVSAPRAAREQDAVPIKELEYVDIEDMFEDDNPYASRPKWQIPDTPEQKEFLAACGAKWFESKQKGKAKAIIKALIAGDNAGKAVYHRCMDYLGDKEELVDVPPLMPRDWFELRKAQAQEHHWTRWGFINALLNRDKLYEHCQLKQRELDQSPASRYRPQEEVEAEMQSRNTPEVATVPPFMPPGFREPQAMIDLRNELERQEREGQAGG